MNIISILQKEVDNIASESYRDDNCPPVFTVSLLQEHSDITGKVNNHKIILTIVHNRVSHSRIILPNLTYQYGYESLENEMKWLYNSTM